MTELLFSWVWIGMEAAALYCLGRAFLKRRLSAGMTVLALLLYQGFALVHSNHLLYRLPLIPEKLIGLLAVALVLAVVFSAPWYGYLAAAAGSFFFFTAVELGLVALASALFGISVEELIWKKAFYAVYVSLMKSVELFLAWGLMRVRTRRGGRGNSRRYGLLAAIFPLISIFLILFLIQNYQDRSDFAAPVVIFSVILILANALALALMESLNRAAEAEKELALQHQSARLQTESFAALERSYRAQRAAGHEFKHRLQVIGNLLREGRTEEAGAYVAQLQEQQTGRILAANTGNPIVDAVLNEKYQRAREEKIDVRYQVNDLSGLRLSADGLVLILANLLDNAIEACCRLSADRQIECSLFLEESLFLSIRNTAPPVEIVDGRIETSKENRAEHGFGLAAVRRIVRQLNGELVLDYSEPWFQVVAEIPNEEDEEEKEKEPLS